MANVQGSAWGENGHVFLSVDEFTGELIHREYNLSDSTGPHAIEHPHKAGRAILPEIKLMAKQALDKAVKAFQYRAERRKDTSFEKLQFAFLATWGRGGHIIYMDESNDSSSTLSGYGFTTEELAEIDRLGIPFVDSRSIPDDLICQTISFPMYPGKPDQAENAPWGGFSYAPIDVCAWLYQSLGATVRNITPRAPLESELRNCSSAEVKAFRGYTSGNTAMLAEGMAELSER